MNIDLTGNIFKLNSGYYICGLWMEVKRRNWHW